jgi:hypothetical protein
MMTRKTSGRKTARQIYFQQNRILHQAFTATGMPYKENREYWALVFEETVKHACGLSALTLGERRRMIRHLQAQGLRLFNPGVPKTMRDWKKGDKDLAMETIREQDPQLRLIHALWGELGYEPKKLRGLVERRYGLQSVRWLNDMQRTALVNYLRYRLQRAGEPAQYYRR